MTRILRAPRELVWQAWTDPAQRVKWMGPPARPATRMEGELRVGAPWRCCLSAPDGSEDLWHGGVYRELVEPERMVFTFAWDGDDGQPENEMLITITFVAEGANTKMTFHQTQMRDAVQRDNHREGWTGTFDRLDQFLAGQR